MTTNSIHDKNLQMWTKPKFCSGSDCHWKCFHFL